MALWELQASELLQELMAARQVTAGELARRLGEVGVELSGQAIRNKLGRGTFSAAFLLAAISCLDASSVKLSPKQLQSRYHALDTERGAIAETLEGLRARGLDRYLSRELRKEYRRLRKIARR